ncbi:MAG: DUF4374 domain-containing protein, partial [Myxococcales bacterium]|nr:DUF4374 domain-containing protein [Myxococcales bacterium]
ATLALSVQTGCDDDDSDGTTMDAAGGGGDAGPVDDAGPGKAEEVIGFAIRVRNPEGRNIYLGAFPEVPEGELDRSKMIELANNDVDFNDGYAYDFSRETGTYTRYSVDADLQMVEGPKLSLANLGLTGGRGTAFVSNTRAYNYGTSGASLVVAVFDPTAMELTGTIPADALANDDFALGIVGKPAIFGDYVAFAVDWLDRANLRTYDKAAVALVKKDSDDEPVFLVEDDRCAGAYETFVDASGDLYAMGTASGGYFGLYGVEPADLPPACALRIKAGETTFDPDFYVDLEAATGTRAVYGAWHIAGHDMLVMGLQDGGDLPAPEDYLAEALFEAYVVDLDTGTSRRLEGIPAAQGMSFREHFLDGTLYYQVYTTVEGTPSVDVYRVDADGTATKQFSTLGDPWSLGTLKVR